MTVVLENEHVELVMDPERGGEIVRFARPGEANGLAHYAWTTPNPPDQNIRYGSTELDWLAGYRGGWQVLFPNAGAECLVDGLPVAFHGEGSISRAQVIEQTATSCTISIGSRLPLELTRTVRILEDSPTVQVEDAVHNIGIGPASFIWGHHPVFPLTEGSVIDAPPSTVKVEPSKAGGHLLQSGQWPRLSGQDGTWEDLSRSPGEQTERLVYLQDLPEGWAALRHPDAGSPSIAMAWDVNAYPHLWLWTLDGADGFPWYGRARMIGIEPQRAWPFDGLKGAIDRGQALTLGPGGAQSSWFTLTLLPGGEKPVIGMDQDGTVHHD
ncbi:MULTISPECIES: hypothetical protein [unclassified Arthrobacter]|uniref:hypothetical protein n=1 Tax=unclassified Arthrobacter TaxID=235627 RepID=UPI0003630838|nr:MULTISPECIES: hypothetical protein [unclassified Arthrobacter]BCW54352.1 hypothetical protein StoSoilB19_17260 [Arthrobacter sp. StoSoilB19]